MSQLSEGRPMFDRRRVLILTAAALIAAPAAAAPKPAAQPPADLSGAWTNAWYTRLERPRGFAGLIATPAEVEAYEAPRRALHGELNDPEHDRLGQATSEFPDNGPGLARIDGLPRSSWIVEPADGRLPWIKEAKARVDKSEPDVYDHVEQRPTDERCLTVPGAAAPMLNSHDADLVQFVQTRDWLLIVGEKNHETRIVRIGDTAAPAPPGQRGGDSVGHWEGRTLVIVTTGQRPGLTKISDELSLTERARVTERLTRTAAGEIRYGFEVDDPGLFTRPWRAEMIFRPAPGRLYEYACHEGNYSLPSILSAARQQDQASAAGAQ